MEAVDAAAAMEIDRGEQQKQVIEQNRGVDEFNRRQREAARNTAPVPRVDAAGREIEQAEGEAAPEYDGGSGGGGGSLFGDSDDERSTQELTDEDRLQSFSDVIMNFVHTDFWTDNGGATLELGQVGGRPMVKMLETTEEARAAAADANRFIETYAFVFFPGPNDPAVSSADSGYLFTPASLNAWNTLETTVVAPVPDQALGEFLKSLSQQLQIPVVLSAGAGDEIINSEAIQSSSEESAFDLLARHAMSRLLDYLSFDDTQARFVINGANRADRRHALYDVRDLISSDASVAPDDVEHLAEVIMEFCDGDAWTDNGGDAASLSAFDGRLFISAPEGIHLQVQVLLAQLRSAHGLSFAQEFRGFVARRQSGAGHRSIRWPHTVVYNVRALLNGENIDESAEELIESLQETVDPDGWMDNGGDTSRAHFFEPLLIIETTPLIHGFIHQVLSARALAAGAIVDLLRAPNAAGQELETAPPLADVLDDADVVTWLQQHGLTASEGTVTMRPEQAIILTQHLLASPAPRRALAIKDAVTQADPDHELSHDLVAAFSGGSVLSAEVSRAVQAVAVRAQQRLDDLALLARAREAAAAKLDRLRRILDDRLLAAALIESAGGESERQAAADVTAAPELRASKADAESRASLVSIAATSVDAAAIDALTAAGATVVDVAAATKIVVAEVPTDRLMSVAELDVVKRMEPATMTPVPR